MRDPPYGVPMNRAQVIGRFDCPACGSAAGQPCQGRNRPRKQAHIERWQLAAEHLGLVPKGD